MNAGVINTFPSDWYVDREVLAEEREKIFFREWLFVGHLCEFESVGSYMVRQVFNQSIIVIRGQDDQIRAFYNVCPHRGHELAQGCGIKETIVCPYHNWSYFPDGRLRHATNAKNVAGFDADSIRLSEIKVELCGPLVFINLDPNPAPLSELVGDLIREIREEYPDIDSDQLEMIDESDFTVQGNWKLDVENFLECYHCAPAHSQFCDVFEVSTQRAELRGNYVFHYADPKPVQKAAYEYDPTIFPKRLATWTIFPNTMIYLFPGKPTIGVMVAAPHPTDPQQSIFWAKTYATDAESAMAEDLFQIMDVTMNEDIDIIESVQRGMQSNGFERGLLLVDEELTEKSEHTVRHFQTYIQSKLD